MRLAVKLMIVFFFAILVVTGVYGYLAVQREEQIFRERLSIESERLAAAMEPAFRGVWRQYGVERAVASLQEIPLQAYRVRVRWVWFDAPRSDPYGPAMPLDIPTLREIRHVMSVPSTGGNGPRRLYAYRLLDLESDRQGGLEFAFPMEELAAAKREAIFDTLTFLGALVAVTGLAVVVAGVTMVGQPLHQLSEKTQRIARGELDSPLELNTGDELSTLADGLNDLCVQLAESEEQVRQEAATRIAALEQLRHGDRLRTVGRLASGIAHELGTPLNVISGHAELMTSSLPAGQVEQSARAIKREADRMAAIIRQLLDFARRDKSVRARTDLRQVVQQTVDLLGPLAAKHQIEFNVQAATTPAFSEIDAGQIHQVLTNVVMNAIQASPQAGQIRIEVVTRDTPAQLLETIAARRVVAIAVEDQGEGIPRETETQVFEPFFTTKEIGEGTGLGLSIAYRILEEHGGQIEIENAEGGGARFVVFLPALDELGSSTPAITY